MTTMFNVRDYVQGLLPEASFTKAAIVLAYGGNARARRLAMRADKQAIKTAVFVNGFGAAEANGRYCSIRVRGHVVQSFRELLKAGDTP